jgi:hypothetical protein
MAADVVILHSLFGRALPQWEAERVQNLKRNEAK